MNKPTDPYADLYSAEPKGAWNEGLHAGIAHGKAEAWQEAIKALIYYAQTDTTDETEVEFLQRIAKERGYV